jgi:hypothetical protein
MLNASTGIKAGDYLLGLLHDRVTVGFMQPELRVGS